MNTWPISIRRETDRVYIGIPDYLGDGRPGTVLGTTPSLEEVAGDEWTAEILRVLLPFDRTWAWCTQSSIFRRSGLRSTTAPAVVDPVRLEGVVSRSRLLRPTTLAFVPASTPAHQETVVTWAGADTEQIPDHIWVAPDLASRWHVDEILDWCEDPARWTNLASVSQRPAERLLILFDRQISCSVPAAADDDVMSSLGRLAARWTLTLVEGAVDFAWPTHR